MLATITLATKGSFLETWIGSTLGMVAADALAIMVGAVLNKRLLEKVIKYRAAALFALFALLLIGDGASLVWPGCTSQRLTLARLSSPAGAPDRACLRAATWPGAGRRCVQREELTVGEASKAGHVSTGSRPWVDHMASSQAFRRGCPLASGFPP